MTIIQFPTNTTEQRESFLAPNGTYYALRFPSLEVAQELVELGITRLVLPMTEFDVRVEWPVAEILWGVEICYQQAG